MWPDKVIAPLPAGTLDRIVASLREGETKTDLLRAAVMHELERRERIARRTAVAALPKPEPIE